MNIRVMMFASLAHRVGVRERNLSLQEGATVGDALGVMAGDYPDLAGVRERLATAVNMAYVRADHRLAEGDELALIPPVSGG